MKTILVLFSICILITACNCNKTKSEQDQLWLSLSIIDDHRTIFNIPNYDDSSTVEFRDIGSVFLPRPKKIKIEKQKIYFTKAERDTLIYLVRSLIINPAKIKNRCTEFVGTVQLSIDYGQFTQSAEYNSVCDWTLLSDQAKQLNNILQRGIKKARIIKN